MNRELTNRVGRSLRHLVLGLTLAFASHPLAAMEELTVDGTKDAAQTRAQQAHFKSQMEAYGKAVGGEFKGRLKAELERTMRIEARLATIDSRSRG